MGAQTGPLLSRPFAVRIAVPVLERDAKVLVRSFAPPCTNCRPTRPLSFPCGRALDALPSVLSAAWRSNRGRQHIGRDFPFGCERRRRGGWRQWRPRQWHPTCGRPDRSPSRGSPWVFNITPILGRCARSQLVCPIPTGEIATIVEWKVEGNARSGVVRRFHVTEANRGPPVGHSRLSPNSIRNR